MQGDCAKPFETHSVCDVKDLMISRYKVFSQGCGLTIILLIKMLLITCVGMSSIQDNFAGLFEIMHRLSM